MKKVSILTLVGRNFNNNYGAVLQAYALQETIKKLNYNTEIIDFNPKASKNEILKKICQRINEGNFLNMVLRISSKNISSKLHKKQEILRNKKFETFRSEQLYLSKKTYNNEEELINNYETSDYYIVGSDQVWNPIAGIEKIKVYLFSFVTNSKKISYAASVSKKIPENYKKTYSDLLKDFDYISVREMDGKEQIKQLTDKNIEIVLDPTLLLSKNEWNRISKEPKNIPTYKYIFVYDLYRSNEILSGLCKFAKKRGLKIINYTPNNIYKKIKYTHVSDSFYEYGPSEFLWYLKNSEYVVTSSFHGTVFSLLFEKEFYAVTPDTGYKGGNAFNSRLTDLLDTLGLKNRILDDPSKLNIVNFEKGIDWGKIDEKLNVEKEKSLNFLKNTLNS
ncbi:polysaccharide pyruvyl transferase family protein [Methanococcus maripaludis]|uniref:Polysaccharide pyruvyl transferase domain-containing protein n=2 Tax=Methanococcus maripaludis TaxID=39152 RepID=A0A7J9PGE8_METMI|nr:polysaccharide pyruvyl transferase family protein [Methanococcus maripaludis]MBA2862302.1 hypothetical protein [Methanococcus maripaludis]